jgi:hypothetical protein
MNDAIQSFKRVFAIAQKMPHGFNVNLSMFEKMLKLKSETWITALKHRDSEGRKIFVFRLGMYDPEEISDNESLQAIITAISLAMYEEETQIAGIVILADYSNFTMKHLYSPSTVANCVKFDNNLNFRMQGFYNINMPSFVQFVFNLGLSMTSEKIKKRIVVMENSEDVKNFIDPKILPKEYGGDLSFEEAVDDLWKLYEKNREDYLKFVDINFDFSAIPESWWLEGSEGDQVGSFRKLEID